MRWLLPSLVLIACQPTSAVDSRPSAPPSGTSPPVAAAPLNAIARLTATAPPVATSAPLPEADEPLACAEDSDCRRLACGPCRSGEVVTQRFVRINCFRNPCPTVRAVCRDKVCVIP